MSSVIIAGNTSGTITLDAPAVAGTTTLTLPTTSGTIALSGGAVSGTTGSFSGDLSFNSGYGSAAVAYGCRAWVNFNGTGTVAIRASGNVSSITDNGVGDYTVNFTNAMPDGNYSVAGSASAVIAQLIFSTYTAATTLAASSRIYITNTTSVGDNALICVAIFR
jgi:uncharacterized protein (AIM24 family)